MEEAHDFGARELVEKVGGYGGSQGRRKELLQRWSLQAGRASISRTGEMCQFMGK
jgi:hypothetical protein